MINNINFYRDFDSIFSKFNLEKNEINNNLYNELIKLYENNMNNCENFNIVSDLEIKSFKIDNDGIII
tara:strand:- start:1339 stop:1542 length:204 start_codon:yes stop_codon:yes gene_type:complete